MRYKPFLISLFVFITAFMVFSANIGGLSIYSLDEAKNSECAREMLERGDFIVPTFNYELRTDKPPVHYYFMIVAYKLFGVNEFSARFFSSVFGALTVLITFLFAQKYLGKREAFLSFIALISSLHFSIQFHMAVPDPYLIFWINAALFSFYIGFKEKKGVFIYLFYIFMGLGVLTKGPVAVVLPSGIILLYLIFTRNLTVENLKFLRVLSGIAVLLIVSLPWYIAVYLKTEGKWVQEFIFKHNIHRFSQPMEGHGGIFLLTFLFVFVGMLPFSVFIFQALKKVWEDRKNDFLLFLMIFAGVYTLFFAVSKTKLPNYTVPVYPSLAIIIGYYLSRIHTSKISSLIVSVILYILISIGVIAGLYFGIKNEPAISDLSYLSIWFIFLVFGGIFALMFLLKKNYVMAILSLSVFSIFTGFIFFYKAFPPVDKRNPVMQMLPLIEKDKPVRYYRNFNPAFVFYLRRHISPVEKAEIKSFLSSKEKVYILTRKRYLKDFKNIENAVILKVVKDLFESKVSALVSNRRER
ncbi:4-amino-4-deoxy-L-arabinose transferase [Persephonella hydrogeniphila]|uniref:4-amino-4-deoxy-L-arabinose transferase n=1 Tax=Persephonella hydrogeniphila TaxID=198703 RepID=A0A285NGN6_9AQUI|nr:glycosyltransferase family 39 protein [Persephonella hydrogeniphila]SNZ07046.1 4-amino-4-deoxy-L-arabinose transferase [Persephonella hydrogeniphila]